MRKSALWEEFGNQGDEMTQRERKLLIKIKDCTTLNHKRTTSIKTEEIYQANNNIYLS